MFTATQAQIVQAGVYAQIGISLSEQVLATVYKKVVADYNLWKDQFSFLDFDQHVETCFQNQLFQEDTVHSWVLPALGVRSMLA
jgi:hypothetical protein